MRDLPPFPAVHGAPPVTRILAFGDTQIGVQTVALADQRAVLDQIVQVALDRKVDVVIHGGDVFEGPVVLPEHLRCFIDGVKPLAKAQIPLIVLLGNGRHDLSARPVHALDVLREVEGIDVHDMPGCTSSNLYWPGWDEKPEDGIGIVTLPFVQPGHLIARMNGQVNRDQINDYAGKLLAQIAGDLFEKLRDGRIATNGHSVLVAHWAISGSRVPTGLDVEDTAQPILSWADLDAIGYDVVIGAHIHEPQGLSNPALDKTLGLVVGSPQQLNHGEHGDHGCWLIEVGADTGPLAEFIPIESPRFVTVTDDPETVAQVRSGDYVRVRFTATEEQAQRIDHEGIRRTLEEAGAAAVKIEPQIIRETRARVEALTTAMSPVEALVAYCEANEVGPETQHRMVGRLQDWQAA